MTQHGGLATLGPFDFRFTRGEVNAYRNALGFPGGEDVPITFSTRALTEPHVLAELRKVFGNQIPIHIEQSFDVTEVLRPDTRYMLTLVMEALRDSRMRLTGTFARPSNETCVVMRSEFLLAQLAAMR